MQVLSGAGIQSIADVAKSEPLRIEHLLNRRSSSFGLKLVRQAQSFPELDLMMSEIKHTRSNDCVESRIELSVSVTNNDKESVAVSTADRQPRYIVCMTTSSDGQVSIDTGLAINNICDPLNMLLSSLTTGA